MKLSKTEAINSYNYFWLLKRIFPYIKPYMGRIIIGFLIAIPLGMIDGVTAFSIKPYMDYVVGKQDWIFHIFNHEFTLRWQVFAYIIPFGVVAFAAFQGVLRYLNSYISKWTSTKITNSVKIDGNKAIVYINSDQKSKAIGKSGLNIRLASTLTGFEIELIESDKAEKSENGLKDLQALFGEL